MKKKVVAVSIAAVSLGLGSFAIAGTSAATPDAAHSAKAAGSSSKEIVYINAINNKEAVVATGVFTGAGKDIAHGQKDVLKLGGGTVTLKHPDNQSHFVPSIDPKTCFATFTITGKYQLLKGTGKYAGVSGHGKYVAHGQTVLPRKSNGNCSKKKNPKTEIFSIKGHGPASLS